MMFIDWQMVVVIGIEIPGIHFEDQNTELPWNTDWENNCTMLLT
jgi:hypothetical protein